MNNSYLTTLILCSTLISFYAVADSDHHGHKHEHKHDHKHEDNKSLDAHVHGLANMTLAIDKTEVEIQFLSPSANIVGFEHKASTDEQRRAVNGAKSSLQVGENLFSFSGSECSLQKVEVDVKALVGDHHDEHRDDHHNHGHKDKHSHHEGKGTHSDIKAHYRFICKSTEQLKSITVNLFKQFPAIETLKTEWVTRTSQGSYNLSSASNTIRLK